MVLRAIYLESRGRRPVDCFGLERNPVKALKAAQQELVAEGKKFFATAVPCEFKILENLLDLLGLASFGKNTAAVSMAPDRAQYTFMQWGMDIPLEAKVK